MFVPPSGPPAFPTSLGNSSTDRRPAALQEFFRLGMMSSLVMGQPWNAQSPRWETGIIGLPRWHPESQYTKSSFTVFCNVYSLC